MNRFRFLIMAGLPLLFTLTVNPHLHTACADGGPEPFALVGRTPTSLSASDLSGEEARGTTATLSPDKERLTFTADRIRLVVTTGPEDDMLSYRIQGVRNPTLVVPKGATLTILFVNTDEDMTHDLHFGTAKPPFPDDPGTAGTVGSSRLPHATDEKYTGEDFVIRADVAGSYTYYCSVRGHAQGGMYGAIAVGAAPETTEPMPAQGHDHMSMPGMAHGESMHHMDHMAMNSSVDLGDPMNREGSGTSWLPDSSPMYMKMEMKGDRMFMAHGSAFPRYTAVGGDRDVSVDGKGDRNRFDAPSMVMGMYSMPAGTEGQLGFRLMMSADPFVELGFGYPLLYQTGESYHDEPIHDRQHPHDLFSELSVTYSRKAGSHNSVYLYAGFPGEPALGPPAFMHRTSAMDNPDAPISHHWQDSTHITFGVATLGLSFGKWKLEGSAFKGQEPNEDRYDFDKLRLDSASGRVSWNPTADLALQISHGSIKKPEPLEPELTRRHRTTASILYNRPLGEDMNWSSSLVWGQNNDTGEGRTGSILFESDYQRRAHTVYGRIERVEKSGQELVLSASDANRVFAVNSLALGYVGDVSHGKGFDVGLGGQVTFDANPAGLDAYYGSGSHAGFQVFMRLRPSLMDMEQAMGHMNMGPRSE